MTKAKAKEEERVKYFIIEGHIYSCTISANEEVKILNEHTRKSYATYNSKENFNQAKVMI